MGKKLLIIGVKNFHIFTSFNYLLWKCHEKTQRWTTGITFETVTKEKKVFCWIWGFTYISSYLQISKEHSHHNKKFCKSKDIVQIFWEDELDWISRIFGPDPFLTIHYFLPDLDIFQRRDTYFVRILPLEMRKM